MFTKRHEQELAEIKALTVELGQRFDEILGELARIRRSQAGLEGAAPDPKPGKGKRARAAKPRGAKAGGPKKARRSLLAGQGTAVRAKAGKPGRATSPGASDDGGRPRKQRDPGSPKRRRPEAPAPSPGSDQE